MAKKENRFSKEEWLIYYKTLKGFIGIVRELENIKVGVGLFFYVVSLVFGILSSVMASILSIHLMIAGLALLEYKMFLVGFGLWSVLIFCLTMGEVIGKET